MNIQEKHGLEANIWKIYLLSFFQIFFLFEPIFFVYLENALGFTMFEMMLISGVFLFTMMLFMIPAGVMGDKLGYKITLSIGTFLILIGVVMWGFANSFYAILIAEIVWAIGWALKLGVQDTLLYETLKSLGRENEFKKTIGKVTALFWIGLASSALIGSLLTRISPWLPVKIGFIPMIIPFIVSLWFVEPLRTKNKTSYLQHTKDALKNIKENERLKLFVFYAVTSAMIVEISYKFFQPLLNRIGVELALFGVIFSISYLLSGAGAFFSYRIEKLLGEKRFLYSFYVGLLVLLISLGTVSSMFAIPLILLVFIIDGIKGPAVLDYLNQNIESHNRATINSISNMVKSLLVAVMIPLFGLLGDLHGISIVFWITAGFSLICIFGLKELYSRAQN
ncbi:MAG: MFS transporter [Candidatus Altiarchaeota archaeon]|nr:MFS transporter [Candidatus Altiarchaeota archaeon]